MITNANINNIPQNNFNQFSKVNLSSNRDYLSYAYGNSINNSNIQYYNDPKKKEKKKLKFITSAALVAISTAAIALNAIPKGKFKLNILQNIHLPENKFKNVNVKDLKIKDKITNLSCNFTNVKDDLWDKVSKKTVGTPFGFIEDIGQKMTKLYKKWVYNSSLAKQYNKAYDELIKKYPDAKNIDLVQDFEKLFKNLDDDILKKLHENGNRISDNLFFKKGFFNKITNETIGDTKINNLDSVSNAFKKIEIPENISNEAKEALNKFNEIKFETAQELVPKLRDINAGNAPTDLITILASTGALVGAVAMEDDKKEKKSIVINLGIPLIATLATQIYGTVKLLSGFKSLIFGLATGQIASQTANMLSMAIENFQNKQKNKNTQP